MAKIKFEFLEHTGDLKFKAQGKNLNEMFENSILAVASVFSRGKKVKEAKTKTITVTAHDKKSMFYKLIEELIYLFDAQEFITARGEITLEKNTLHAKLFGDQTKNYKDLDAIKSPTYAEMYIKKTRAKFECQMVLDV
jgi:SHS2 domain-containing protein